MQSVKIINYFGLEEKYGIWPFAFLFIFFLFYFDPPCPLPA